ncbi:MAG: threonyl-tRNA synthetase [Gemmatimonadetes bacterium]|nr:threonyl-tRNA synthetase [Gemmatimonadota bacterium]
MGSAKSQVEQLLRSLPDDCSLGDIQYHVSVLQKIDAAIRSAESGPTYSQEEAEEAMWRWIDE